MRGKVLFYKRNVLLRYAFALFFIPVAAQALYRNILTRRPNIRKCPLVLFVRLFGGKYSPFAFEYSQQGQQSVPLFLVCKPRKVRLKTRRAYHVGQFARIIVVVFIYTRRVIPHKRVHFFSAEFCLALPLFADTLTEQHFVFGKQLFVQIQIAV